MNAMMQSLIVTYGVGVELPWILALIPAPIIITKLLRTPDEASNTAVRAAHFEYFTQQHEGGLTNTDGAYTRRTKTILWISWLLFLITLSRPFVLGEAIQKPQPTRDIMLAVDLSESMENMDMQIRNETSSRLDAAKHVLADFVERRTNDRLGLLYFADTAYLASPLTTDKNTLTFLLEQSQVGLIGDATSITDAIGLTTRLFSDYEGELPALILLTDGDNTSGNIDKSEAVDLATSANIQIFSIVLGMGYNDGNNEIDMGFLEAIASGSGGELFFAKDADALAQIYRELDERALNPTTMATYSPKHYLHFYTMVLSLLCLCFLLVSHTVSNRVNRAADKEMPNVS